MSAQMTLWGTRKPTSLPESEDGPTHYGSLDGLTTNPSGPALAPANPSPTPGKVLERPTSATSGRRCSGSSKSAALQSSLESRLTVLMAGLGSPLYDLTWKTQNMPWGGALFRLRASGLRTPGIGFSGLLPTPVASEERDSALPEVLAKCDRGGRLGRWICARSSTARSIREPVSADPALSRFLMGYPPEWDAYAPTEMPSRRKSGRSSSGQ